MISLGGGNSFGEEMRMVFSETGLLSKSPDFEYRAEQQQMAGVVAEALEGERSLVVEAGTGVGKSLAYLIPAVEYAIREGKKAVISTHTINLQEQLIGKDLPIVRKLLAEPFEAALLKGRGNYLCPMRLRRAMDNGGDLFTSSEQEELMEMAEPFSLILSSVMKSTRSRTPTNGISFMMSSSKNQSPNASTCAAFAP
ncbi:DEAD/DEAH box helicase [Akkermansiaceae bacterium]|nr:DEAD/DEAH box helicase [Akkermansiaceae bacterium]